MDFKDFGEFIERAQKLLQENKEFAICTVIESSGSTPQRAGSRMIVTEGGESFGTVGGGVVESDTINKAIELLKRREAPQTLRFELNEKGKGVCGGSMTIFIEGVYRKNRVIIFGAGHVAEAVCDILKRLNYRITVFDNREERLGLIAFEGCEKVCGDYRAIRNYLNLEPEADILVMTPNHEYDFVVIKQLLREPFRSLGLLGSKRKKVELYDYLKKEGFGEEEIAKVRIPLGIEIGSRTPYEIAISIAAELIRMNSERR